jgi:hypothetical protein
MNNCRNISKETPSDINESLTDVPCADSYRERRKKDSGNHIKKLHAWGCSFLDNSCLSSERIVEVRFRW